MGIRARPSHWGFGPAQEAPVSGSTGTAPRTSVPGALSVLRRYPELSQGRSGGQPTFGDPMVQLAPAVTARRRRGRHSTKWTVAAIAALCLVALIPAPAAAKRIHKTVPTHFKASATRAADGTITATGSFTSPNRRCLSAKRFKATPKNGRSYVSGVLNYSNGGTAPPPVTSGAPFPGALLPISPPGQSPYDFQAVWPGNGTTRVENHADPTLPLFYQSTVAAASALAVHGWTVPRGPQRSYKVRYHHGGSRVVLTCRPLSDYQAANGSVIVF